MNRAKILIADDHAMIRDGVKSLLSKNKGLSVAGEASNGHEALEKYKSIRPDLLILDLSMPGMNGMDAAEQILKDDPTAKIIILSMFNDEDYISRCMEHGVKGYVVKNETGSELDQAVNTVLKGQTYFSNEVQKIIFRKYSNSVMKKKKIEQAVKLTGREVEIVKLISEGLTSHEMAEKLFISPRTVETHRANLMKKAGVKNSIELVKKIERMGLI
jgi:DNA-binding NarL/FixJ family response regulator